MEANPPVSDKGSYIHTLLSHMIIHRLREDEHFFFDNDAEGEPKEAGWSFLDIDGTYL